MQDEVSQSEQAQDISLAQAAMGRAVRELRARRGLSQDQLGLRAQVHRNYVGAIERGEINPTLRTLRVVAGALDIRLSSLIRLAELRAEGSDVHAVESNLRESFGADRVYCVRPTDAAEDLAAFLSEGDAERFAATFGDEVGDVERVTIADPERAAKMIAARLGGNR